MTPKEARLINGKKRMMKTLDFASQTMAQFYIRSEEKKNAVVAVVLAEC